MAVARSLVVSLLAASRPSIRLFVEIHPEAIEKAVSAGVMLLAMGALMLEIHGRSRAGTILLLLAIFLFMVFWPA